MIGTKIEWATDTVNFWWGCAKVSPACEHCYAESLDARFHPSFRAPHGFTAQAEHWGPTAPRLLKVEPAIRDLQKIARRGHKTGERPRVFVNSMSDFFEDRGDLDEARLAALDAMRLAPEVDFLLLTKRPEKIRELLDRIERDAPGSGMSDWMRSWLKGNAPRNIWLGTTVENQEWADRRIPELLKVPAAVRFLSCEPMLGPVDLDAFQLQAACYDCGNPITMNAFYATATCGCCCEGPESLATGHIDWVICGGESGAHARPMHPDWARSLRDQCKAAGVPFHFKQWGEWSAIDQPMAQESPVWLAANEQWFNHAGGQGFHGRQVWRMRRVGKKAAGRLLDGIEHNRLPETHP